MRKATVAAVAVVIAVGTGYFLDWQASKGSVITRDGVTLIEANRPRFLQLKNISRVGFSAKLAKSEEGCVGVEGTDGNFHPVVWDHGTRLISTEPLAIEFGGQKVESGGAVVGSAPGDDVDRSAHHQTYWSDIPERCRADTYAFVLTE